MAPPSKEYAQPSSPTRSEPTQATGGPSSDVSADVSAASSGGVSPDGAHRLNAQMGNSFVASMVMRDAAGGGGVDTSAAMASAGRSSGHALGGATQGAMESSFGADFSGVQVHTDVVLSQLHPVALVRHLVDGDDGVMST